MYMRFAVCLHAVEIVENTIGSQQNALFLCKIRNGRGACCLRLAQCGHRTGQSAPGTTADWPVGTAIWRVELVVRTSALACLTRCVHAANSRLITGLLFANYRFKSRPSSLHVVCFSWIHLVRFNPNLLSFSLYKNNPTSVTLLYYQNAILRRPFRCIRFSCIPHRH